jgi:hypothetical protein
MSKALNKRISKAFDTIYERCDSGLEYMDRHTALDAKLMEFFYNDAVETLSRQDKERMAVMLETIVSDMEFDLEY